MFKKRLIPVLTGLLIFCFSSSVFAMPVDTQTSSKRITYKASEITDIDKLIDRAKKGISDIPKEKVNSNYTLKNDVTDAKIAADSLVTTQLLQQSTVGDSNVNEYATTTISIIPMTSLSQYNEDYDGSYGVKAYSTIYWSKTTINGQYYSRLTSTSGGWTVSDYSISVSKRHVIQSEFGTTSTGQIANPSNDLWPASNSYNGSVSWPNVNTQGVAEYYFGNNTDATLTRGTTTWTLYHYNLYNG